MGTDIEASSWHLSTTAHNTLAAEIRAGISLSGSQPCRRTSRLLCSAADEASLSVGHVLAAD